MSPCLEPQRSITAPSRQTYATLCGVAAHALSRVTQEDTPRAAQHTAKFSTYGCQTGISKHWPRSFPSSPVSFFQRKHWKPTPGDESIIQALPPDEHSYSTMRERWPGEQLTKSLSSSTVHIMSRKNCQEVYLAVRNCWNMLWNNAQENGIPCHTEISIWQLHFKSSSRKEVPSFSLSVLQSTTKYLHCWRLLTQGPNALHRILHGTAITVWTLLGPSRDPKTQEDANSSTLFLDIPGAKNKVLLWQVNTLYGVTYTGKYHFLVLWYLIYLHKINNKIDLSNTP